MSIDKIWKKYKDTKDIQLKNQLIEHYVQLVKIVAGRMYNYYGSKVEYDDLVGYGILGLIDSIDKFNIDKDIKFETYAQIRIRGEMIDNVRRLDWIPRSLRSKSKEIQDATFKLQNQLGRRPTNEEIAKKLNISLSELESTLGDMATFNVSSLEDMIVSQGDYAIDLPQKNMPTPEEEYENADIKRLLSESIEELDEREQLIISLYYYDELTYKEIGEVLELSESRISQIHSQSILNMKNSLKRKGISEGI